MFFFSILNIFKIQKVRRRSKTKATLNTFNRNKRIPTNFNNKSFNPARKTIICKFKVVQTRICRRRVIILPAATSVQS